ncbi:DinB family protein [Hufsiella ginkgonis]|uniref:DinB family protein n=1 Tax=Hufsiella ginkgonis TaxID=2695274 RepID=A0A7K1Y2F7_9SPHI|nr:DinB family protein [Hufsiella ginkgonis]MXV17258.1 DinB family protein [Hufsiella ginkgonis]
MTTKTATTRMQGFLSLFDMHTTFFARALEGVAEKDMYNRLDTQANHMGWLTGSLVQQRIMMASETHPGLHQAGEELFKDHRGIQDSATYPTIAEYQADWDRISPMAREALATISDEKLDSDFDMGGMKITYYELISFTIYREASIIGQLALWRRLLGYAALKYD